jgi:hypothetical protein
MIKQLIIVKKLKLDGLFMILYLVEGRPQILSPSILIFGSFAAACLICVSSLELVSFRWYLLRSNTDFMLFGLLKVA